MTQRELALYETVKLVLNQLIASGVLDYKQTRETLKARATAFGDKGYNDAAAMITTMQMAIEPKRTDSVAPMPMASLERQHTTDLRHAVIIDL